MEFPRRTITSTHFWHIAQYYEKQQVGHHLAKIHECYVSPRSTSEQKAHYLVHQLDSKTKLSKHTIPTSYRCLATTLFNACLTYQDNKMTNLLILALNRFDNGVTIPDDIFMNTLSTITYFALISKLEFHTILNLPFVVYHFILISLHLNLQLD
jgi:hypothetical protein